MQDKELLREHWRKDNRTNATRAAPLGYAIPFVALLLWSCLILSLNHQSNQGILWAVMLFVSFLATFLYYVWVVTVRDQAVDGIKVKFWGAGLGMYLLRSAPFVYTKRNRRK